MTRNNILYLVVGALCVAVAVLGYQVYQDRKKPEGVNINLGPGGISIEKNSGTTTMRAFIASAIFMSIMAAGEQPRSR